MSRSDTGSGDTPSTQQCPVPPTPQIAPSGCGNTPSAYPSSSREIGAQIEVDSPTLGPVYLTTRTNGDALAGQGVYTVFILGDKPPAVTTCTLRLDR